MVITLKAYRLNEMEAWAGVDLEDAIAVAMEETGLDRDDVYDAEYGDELPGELVIHDDDWGSTVMTILTAMQAQGVKGPVCFFGDY